MPPIDPTGAQAAAQPAHKHDQAMPRFGRTSAEWRATESVPAGESSGFWGEDGFSFGDLVDLVNPLQHIPVLSSIYRQVTGDTIAPGPRLIGDGLFSITPIGAAASMTVAALDLAIAEKTGSDIGGHVAQAFGLGDDGATAVAETEAPPELFGPPPPAPQQTAAAEAPPPAQPAVAPAADVQRQSEEPAPRAPVPAAATPADPGPGPAATPDMSAEQWSALLASLGADAAPVPERAPAAQTSTPPPSPVPPAGATPAAYPGGLPEGGVAAAMADALDKYAALQRTRLNPGETVNQDF